MALLAPDPHRIALGGAEPASDRVPAELAGGTPEPLRSQLAELVGAEQVLGRVLDLVRYASDASPYRLLPKAVVVARDGADVARLMGFSKRVRDPAHVPLGRHQPQRAGAGRRHPRRRPPPLLRRRGRGLRACRAGRAGDRPRPRQPGARAPHGTRLGPDPASTDFATVGGVIANNSGGMRCGTTADSYSTVTGLRFVLPSGTEIDTRDPDAEERFAAAEPELAAGLAAIREEILADEELAERIRRKFEIKNTTGYRLCAFLDAETPAEIFRRLLVGSEGTLAFIAEATYETGPGAAEDDALVDPLPVDRRCDGGRPRRSSPPARARSS